MSNASTRLGGNDFDWSVSLSNFPSSCNMMLRLSSPVLSMIESYLGSRDKLNLRLTCKLLYAELPQHELPLYRPHFMPTSTLQSSFVSATDQVVPSPLFLERFGASKVVENAKLLRSSHSIARACMSCNHHLPHSAITLPTLAHCGVDQPILKMADDHNCFHSLPATYQREQREESYVYPIDTVFAVNLLQFNCPDEYTSTVFLCCSHSCFRTLAVRMSSAPTPVALIGQEIIFVQKLDDQRIGVELRYFTVFSRHLSLLVDYTSTTMIIRKFRFRMENFHYRAPSGGYFTSLDFNTFAEIIPKDVEACSRMWASLTETMEGAPSSHMVLKSMVTTGLKTEGMQWFPETPMEAEEFSNFLERFNHIATPHPHLYVEEGEEGGDLLLMEMQYSFAAIIYNDGIDWCLEAFVHNFNFPAHQNRALLSNLRTNLQTHYECSPLQRGMVGVHGTYQRLRFEFFILSCDEVSVISASEYEYEDLMDETTESEVDSEEA